jgi:hypothetical protein
MRLKTWVKLAFGTNKRAGDITNNFENEFPKYPTRALSESGYDITFLHPVKELHHPGAKNCGNPSMIQKAKANKPPMKDARKNQFTLIQR